MATNLVSFIMQYLTPDLIARIADALGLDRGNTQTAVGAAVPALLAGLCNTAAQPGGAQKLADAARQQASTLDNLASMTAGSMPATLADTGSRMLSSLFGGTQSALAGSIAKSAGMSEGESTSLLGMLAPVVMGAIAKQQQGGRVDAGSVASLLAAQKDNIAAALPTTLRNQLRNSGLLQAFDGAADRAGAAAGETARAASYATQRVGDAGGRAMRAAETTSWNWLYWAVPGAAIAALVIYLLAGPAERATQEAANTLPERTAVRAVTAGGVDVGKQVGDTLATLRTSLQDIKDQASAEANLPKLQQVTTQIDSVRGSVRQLTPEQRKVIAGMIKPTMPTVNRMFDNVMSIPGVPEVLKPTVDNLKTQLAGLDSGG
jgi:hypothetical protein